MTTPEISIILPTYNGERYITKSIESCLEQTFQNFELIIVNDCSTDKTPEIIEAFAKKDARIRVINNPFNKKLPLSLNTGFEVARGRYFTWTSDDNFYASNALETLHRVFEKNKEVDLVYTDYTLIDENDRITGVREFGDINASFNKWLGCGACFLYKREIHRANNGYRPEAFLIEDYDFFVRAYLHHNFTYLPSTDLYYYREHSSSLTATQNDFINDVSKMFLERNLPGLEKKLSQKEKGLLYRKFAVYYAVQKNNLNKYGVYLDKLSRISRIETLKTVVYVFFKKLVHSIQIGLSGVFTFFKLLFKKEQ